MNLLQVMIGFSAGAVIAAGVFAFLTTVGVLTRIAGKTGTKKHIRLYEDCIVVGAAVGNYINLAEPRIYFNNIATSIFGIFSGIFVGCLIMSLAETIDTIPVVIRNTRMKKGVQYVILSIAIGKMIGAFIYFYYNF